MIHYTFTDFFKVVKVSLYLVLEDLKVNQMSHAINLTSWLSDFKV